MTFSSAVFLFALLPFSLILYQLTYRQDDSRSGIICIVFISLVFYASWDVRFLPLLLFSCAGNYFLSGRMHSSACQRHRSRWLIIALAFNLGLLSFFKYTGFLTGIVNDMLSLDLAPPPIILPLGISFFTFTQTAYLIDLYRGKTVERDFFCYLLFVVYFPHLIAGPILHHSEMMPQFRSQLSRPLRAANIAVGLSVLTIGLFKKVWLADEIADYANPAFLAVSNGATLSFIEAWTAVLSYTMQLYFDFSGYCDMAIGLSFLFGIRLPMNFNSPYKASSIIDFWRRWHITLSNFLRDYLYFPLGGNRKGSARRYLNLAMVMFLGGLWHGAGWTFVVWGLLHGTFLVINHVLRNLFAFSSRIVYASVFGRIATFLAVAFAWTFFRAESLSDALGISISLAGFNGFSFPLEWVRYPLLAEAAAHLNLSFTNMPNFTGLPSLAAIACLLLITWFAPNSQEIMARFTPALEHFSISRWSWRPTWRMAVIFALALGAAAQRVIFEPSANFLYFQF